MLLRRSVLFKHFVIDSLTFMLPYVILSKLCENWFMNACVHVLTGLPSLYVYSTDVHIINRDSVYLWF